MTNFDPGGFLMLLTMIPAAIAGIVSIGSAKLLSRFGYGAYGRNAALVMALLLLGWIVAAFLVSTSMLQILAVTLSMVGAFAVTRSLASTSYGWVLGVILMFGAFGVLSASGVYQGVDQTGVPQGVISRHLRFFYYAGLLVFGAVGGKTVQFVQTWFG